jgi:hypothetical protein
MNIIIECLLLITFINLYFYYLLDSQIFALYMLFNIYEFIEFVYKYNYYINDTFEVILLYMMIILHIFLVLQLQL